MVWLFAVLLQWNRDGGWTMYRSQLVNLLTGSIQHATGRVERPGESQEALDGKKFYICADGPHTSRGPRGANNSIADV